jgi:hypothetical protein
MIDVSKTFCKQDVSRDIVEAATNLVVRLSKEQKEKHILDKIRLEDQLRFSFQSFSYK